MVNQFGSDIRRPGAGHGQGVRQISVALSGTTPKTLVTKKYGAYRITATSTIAGAPVLTCDVAKRSSTDLIDMKNAQAWPAIDTCALTITWNPGANIMLMKSLSSFNGIYTVIIIGHQ